MDARSMTSSGRPRTVRRLRTIRTRRRARRLQRFLEQEIWAVVPDEILGREFSREEEEDVLGYGPSGA